MFPFSFNSSPRVLEVFCAASGCKLSALDFVGFRRARHRKAAVIFVEPQKNDDVVASQNMFSAHSVLSASRFSISSYSRAIATFEIISSHCSGSKCLSMVVQPGHRDVLQPCGYRFDDSQCVPNLRQARVADSSSRNAVRISSARTTNRFPPSRCASTIQIVRPSQFKAENPTPNSIRLY